VVQEFGINDRRLRDLIASRKDIKKEWVLNEKGKRTFVQYYLDIPKPPTKLELVHSTLRQIDLFNDTI
jgi:hypothetical protein